MNKKWVLSSLPKEELTNQFSEFPPLLASLLFSRGKITQEEIDMFLFPDYARDIHDPFLFRDMERAVERIFHAIEKNEKIIVHGDYDSDGVCSSSLLMTVLEALGSKNHEIFLPHREKEGYGLSGKSVLQFQKNHVKIIITTDCGIANVSEVALAQENSMDVIITDHHRLQNIIPRAFAIIHPLLPDQKYPFLDLAGTGVAFKLAQGLIAQAKKQNISVSGTRFGEDITWDGFEKWLLDLVAIATVTDMMELKGENRVLVKYGLLVLNKTKRIGLKELFRSIFSENKKQPIDAWGIGFVIGPRLNATGRLDSSSPSYDILMTQDQSEAQRFVLILESSNKERQLETARILREGKKQIELTEEKTLLALHDSSWHVGVIGLAAGKFSQDYHRPTIVSTVVDGEIRGSGRGIEGFNMVAALEQLTPYLSRFGGHPQACGFSLKNVQEYQEFIAKLDNVLKEQLKGKDLTPVLTIDAKVRLNDLNWKLYEYLEHFEPFGKGNPRPRFLLEKIRVQKFDQIGKEAQHIRLIVEENGMKRTALGFGKSEMTEGLQLGKELSLVVELNKNVWNGFTELQLLIIDWKFE